MRMRAGDLLASAFPAGRRLPRRLAAGDLPVPIGTSAGSPDHHDCLTEATDLAGLIKVLTALARRIDRKSAVDTTEPSAFARGILSSELTPSSMTRRLKNGAPRPSTPADRSTSARLTPSARSTPPPSSASRDEAWPTPESAEEVHDALLWMGFVTDAEAATWIDWLIDLGAQKRVTHRDGRWFAVDGLQEPKHILFGRLEALGPVHEERPRIALPDVTALLMELGA